MYIDYKPKMKKRNKKDSLMLKKDKNKKQNT